MREIKFRAWDEDTKKMYQDVMFVTGSSVYLSKDNWVPHTRMDGTVCTHIMQYTGLKDKNGKEIYEGDILHHILPNGENWYYPVNWEKQGWMPIDMEKYEIIGNIYENPELL